MQSRTADIIIIGGGVTGLSIALHLRELGVEKVVILERHHVGAGQSGRAAGIVRALVNNTAVSAMLMESLHFFRGFNEKYGEGLHWNQTGYLLVDDARHEESMNRALRNAVAECGSKRIGYDEASELQPGLRRRPDDIYAFEPAAIHLDAMHTTQALMRAARRMGVEIRQGCEVSHLIRKGSSIEGVETNQGKMSAERVVIATSVLGAAQLQTIGIEIPVYPRRTEMAFFSVVPESSHRLRRIVSDARTLLYLRPEGSDQMFTGWREGDRSWSPGDSVGLDPENYRQTANYTSLADMAGRLADILPFMADGFAHRTYACVYDYTPDGMPILDRADSLPGLYFALGFSGGGFSISPWVGSAMARFVVSGVKPPEMHFLRLERFLTGELVSWSNTAEAKV